MTKEQAIEITRLDMEYKRGQAERESEKANAPRARNRAIHVTRAQHLTAEADALALLLRLAGAQS